MVGKRIVTGVISAVLAVSLCPGVALGSELQTADIEALSPQVLSEQASVTLKSKGVKFDLKKGKVLSTSRYLRGTGNVPYYVRLDNATVTSSTRAGYKKAELTITFKAKKNLTLAQKKKIMAAFKAACKTDPNASSLVYNEKISSSHRWLLVDYVTGKNIENHQNNINVTSSRVWSFNNYAGYKDKSGWWFKEPMKATVKVTIEYPATYKNLCFGVGCDKWTNYSMSKYDASFLGKSSYWNKGRKTSVKPFAATYYKTNFLSKAKNNYHFIRLP